MNAATGGLETEAEILKLARLLDVDADSLDYLSAVDPADLRILRTGVTDMLFDIGGGLMSRLGGAAKLLPAPLAASICERAFGPMLAARTAAATDPGRAVEIAQRLSPDFLTEVTIQIDPRRVAKIVSGVPADLVARVAADLSARREFVTMGRFLTLLSPQALAAALAELDDEAVLRTAFVLEDRSSVDQAIAALAQGRLQAILECASAQDLWPQLLTLLEYLSPVHRAEIADTVSQLPVRQRARIEKAADRLGLRAEYDATLAGADA